MQFNTHEVGQPLRPGYQATYKRFAQAITTVMTGRNNRYVFRWRALSAPSRSSTLPAMETQMSGPNVISADSHVQEDTRLNKKRVSESDKQKTICGNAARLYGF